MVMSSFRRSVVADTKKKGGKSKGAWYDKMKLPTTNPGAPIVLVRADYVDPAPSPEQIEIDPATGRAKPVTNPYYKFRKHVRAMQQGVSKFIADTVCSQGLDQHAPQPCVGCFAIDSGDKSVNVSDAFAFTIVHLAYYHTHPLIDREKGGIVMKNDNSGAVMITTECGGRTCNFCRVMSGQPPLPPQPGQDAWPGFDPRSLGTVFGKRRYLELGKGHLSDLQGIDEVISAQCGTCRSQLISEKFVCPHCNSTIIDMSTDARSDEQIAQDALRPYPCMQCQRPVLLKEVVGCDNCESQNAKALQLTIFDVVMYGMRQGEGTKSHITQGLPHKSLDEFARTIDPAFLGGKSLRDYIAEMGKPYSFEEMLAPASLQEQAQRLKLQMPNGMGAPQPQYQQYPGQPGQQPQYQQQVQQPGQMFAGQPPLQPAPGQPPYQQYPAQQPQMQPMQPQYAQPQMQPGPQQPGPQPFIPVGPPNFNRG